MHDTHEKKSLFNFKEFAPTPRTLKLFGGGPIRGLDARGESLKSKNKAVDMTFSSRNVSRWLVR